MKIKTALFLVLPMMIALCPGAKAMEASLESRDYTTLSLAVDKITTDCSAFIKKDKTLLHMQSYITQRMGDFVTMDYSATVPFLIAKVDCMKLEDVRGGDIRVVGYSLSIDVHFYRPFYENTTYVFASPWNKSMLIYIPHESFTQADFEEYLDMILEEFCTLWLDEHNALPETDNRRVR